MKTLLFLTLVFLQLNCFSQMSEKVYATLKLPKENRIEKSDGYEVQFYDNVIAKKDSSSKGEILVGYHAKIVFIAKDSIDEKRLSKLLWEQWFQKEAQCVLVLKIWNVYLGGKCTISKVIENKGVFVVILKGEEPLKQKYPKKK